MLRVIKTVYDRSYLVGGQEGGYYLIECDICGYTFTDLIRIADRRRGPMDCLSCIKLAELEERLLTTAYATNEIILRGKKW